MRSYFKAILFVATLLTVKTGIAQTSGNLFANRAWNAYWIATPNESGHEYGVYYFRKTISFDIKPASFIVHVSADNRYKLYVNGTLVSLGPARGDTYYWNYETV